MGKAAGAEHCNKNLHQDDPADTGIDHLSGAAVEIDEQLLAGSVHLAHLGFSQR